VKLWSKIEVSLNEWIAPASSTESPQQLFVDLWSSIATAQIIKPSIANNIDGLLIFRDRFV
jgi:hypothetical protein